MSGEHKRDRRFNKDRANSRIAYDVERRNRDVLNVTRTSPKETIDRRWQAYLKRHPQSDAMIDGRADMTSDDGKKGMYTLSEGGRYLEISGAALKRVILKLDIAPDGSRIGAYGNTISLYSEETLERIADTDAYAKEYDKRVARHKDVKARYDDYERFHEEERERVGGNVIVNVRHRYGIPRESCLFVGPTNSGKSYQAIERLIADYEADPDGIYVYAGPLRMLAFEVYEKIQHRIGTDDVGFVTGEEQINENAHIRCCTVEMAPMEGTSLVLDEAHWMVDPDRGQYWTNLLIGGEYERFYVITADKASGAVTRMLSDSMRTERVDCHRLTPLEYGGSISVSSIPERSAVIAFSRRGVYSLASRVHRETGMRCGVLYGALPLDVRRDQIEKYVNGEYDVMATTDVIGHGINLPIDNVVFSQTSKFDGTMNRELHVWEAAQIAGRAGRYGMTDKGMVYTLEHDVHGRPIRCDVPLVEESVRAATGECRTDLFVEKGMVTPRLSDLGVTDASDLMLSLDEWEEKANEVLADRGITAAPMRERRRLITAMASFSGAPLYPWSPAVNGWLMSPAFTWTLSSAPLDPDGDALYHIVGWACDDDPSTSIWLEDYFRSLEYHYDMLEGWLPPSDEAYDLERIYASLAQLKTIYSACGTLGTLEYDDVIGLMSDVDGRIGDIVQKVGVDSETKRRRKRRNRR